MYAYAHTDTHACMYETGVVAEKLGFIGWVRSEKWDNVCA